MPCYLFTLHAYGSWLPDRPQGYVHHDTGFQPANPAIAAAYRRRMRENTTRLESKHQQQILEVLHHMEADGHLRVEAVAMDPSHVHLLASWTGPSDWSAMRRRIKHTLSHCLNTRFGQGRWFSQGGSRKRVHDHEHFDHLVSHYLLSHRGVVWTRRTGRLQ